MKRLSLPASLFAAIALAAVATPAMSSDVGVSVSIGQPGFYGQIDIGHVAPRVIYTRPVVIERVPHGVVYAPVYMRVPPAYSSNWRSYCGRYNACGRPVYFVQDNWYNSVYVPYYRSQYRDNYRYNGRYNDGYGDRYNNRYDDNRQGNSRSDRYDNGNHRSDYDDNRGKGRKKYD